MPSCSAIASMQAPFWKCGYSDTPIATITNWEQLRAGLGWLENGTLTICQCWCRICNPIRGADFSIRSETPRMVADWTSSCETRIVYVLVASQDKKVVVRVTRSRFCYVYELLRYWRLTVDDWLWESTSRSLCCSAQFHRRFSHPVPIEFMNEFIGARAMCAIRDTMFDKWEKNRYTNTY